MRVLPSADSVPVHGHGHQDSQAYQPHHCGRSTRPKETRWVRKFIRLGSGSASFATGDSRWYADKDYQKFLHEDLKIRRFLKKAVPCRHQQGPYRARSNKAKVFVHAAKAGNHHRQACFRPRRPPRRPQEDRRHRGLPQRHRGPQGRDGRTACGREHCCTAGEAGQLPPCDEEGSHPSSAQAPRASR